MARFLSNTEKSIGKIPGELIFLGKRKSDVIIKLIDYDVKDFLEKELSTIEEALTLKANDSVTWLNLYGLHDTSVIKEIGEKFEIHPLALEDILNTGQRPKMEEYENNLFFSLKMFQINKSENMITSVQISIILGENYLITFQEEAGEVFEPVRKRIRKNKGRVRKNGAGYLVYALLDTIIDNYLVVIGSLGEEIEEFESEVLTNPNKDTLGKIYSFKQEVSYLRKSIRPTKDFIVKLNRIDSDYIQDEALPFLKDLLDLTIQASEATDIYNEILSDQLEMYNSGMNNRLNEIMKVLTIFSVIFIPLTFIAGIYGTNFEYIPELKYRYGYFIFWGVLVITAILMLGFFKRKKWL